MSQAELIALLSHPLAKAPADTQVEEGAHSFIWAW
jgi:hypothetical protein